MTYIALLEWHVLDQVILLLVCVSGRLRGTRGQHRRVYTLQIINVLSLGLKLPINIASLVKIQSVKILINLRVIFAETSLLRYLARLFIKEMCQKK